MAETEGEYEPTEETKETEDAAPYIGAKDEFETLLFFALIIFSAAFLLYIVLLQLKKRLLSEKRTFLEGSTEAWEAVGEHRQSVSDDEIRGVKARSLSNTGSQSLRNKKESFSNVQEKSGIFSLKSLIKAVDVSLWALLWYGFSVSLVVYNKWLLNSWQGGFKFPLIMSTSHMILKLVFAFALVKIRQEKLPTVSRKVFLYSAIPVGIATALDIAASNTSYLYVSVPFYTIVKSSSVIFVLFFSIVYKLQPSDKHLVISALIISGGVCMAVYGEIEFSMFGLLLVLSASAIGGFRWALTQLLMMQIGGDLGSLLTIYFISPSASVVLLPFAIWLEAKDFIGSPFVQDKQLLLLASLNIVGSGSFAFAMIFVELALIRKTSSLSLAVISYVKQFLQILLSVLMFDAKVTVLNMLGMFITIVGMFFYTYIKNSDKPLSDEITTEDAVPILEEDHPKAYSDDDSRSRDDDFDAVAGNGTNSYGQVNHFEIEDDSSDDGRGEFNKEHQQWVTAT